MPLYKRKPFEANLPPKNLKDDEEVYYLKLTNEIFREYDDYYARVILCNSMVWACSLTGKANLTFQEALDSERAARKNLKGFQRALKKALLFTATLTERGRFPDVVDDVLAYARDRYFVGEEVLSVMGNLWCPSRVLKVIEPTPEEIENYAQEQIAKGEAENNDYLKDDTWGPAPDLFRYEVEELDPDDPNMTASLILDAIDVKREKAALTRDKCKFLLKLAMDYDEDKRKFVLKDNVSAIQGIKTGKFSDIFVGKPPIFEQSLGLLKVAKTTAKSSSGKADKSANKSGTATPKGSPKGKEAQTSPKPKKTVNDLGKSTLKKEKKLTAEQMRLMELEKKAKEREKVKAQKKMVADFKRLWFKAKEDLEVEDHKDLPTPDPISFAIPNHLFGDFMMVLEFMTSYSQLLKVRDCFPNGVTLEAFERALTKNEVSGPLSDIVQILLRTIFRLQEGEQAEVAKDEGGSASLAVSALGDNLTVEKAIQQATSAAAWSQKHQNIPLYKLGVDHTSVSEVLRLHLLGSGAKQSPQSRGSCAEYDDPGLYLKMNEPQILRTLSWGTMFDLSISEKLKVLQCLIDQIVSYYAVKDIMEESFELFRQARVNFRSLVAAEKRKEAEDQLWRQRLKADRVIPDMEALKAAAEKQVEAEENVENEGADAPPNSKDVKKSKKEKESAKALAIPSNKPLLTDEQIEAALAKKDREIARRKQDYAWKESDLMDQIIKHERKLGGHPLGRDRAFRRYWVFPTVPGLFVEHDDEFIGHCLPVPTPYIGEVDFNNVAFIKEYMDKVKPIDKEGSDKENSNTPKKNSKKKSTPNTPVNVVKKEVAPSIFGMCTADDESCPVHSQYSDRPKWYFFWDPEQIEILLAGLSTRGIREKGLKASVLDMKDYIKGTLKKCPVTKLNKEKQYPESVTSAPERRKPGGGAAKTHSDPNLGYPTGAPINKILDLTIRDMILEFEEKIFLGGLGSLKVSERSVWRTEIQNQGYKSLTETLCWGGGKVLSLCDDEGGSEEEDNSSKMVTKLAFAILQLQQSVEQKFMRRPLVEGDDEKKKKKTETEAAWRSIWNSTNTPVERWQLSLIQCTSYSQLFIHFSTLDNSVEWSRSVLNARCRVCRRKGDPEKMLLCDDCNKGHHIYCLKPPLSCLPKGDWFCVDCQPDEPLPTPSKKRPLRGEELDDELTDDEEGDEENTNKASDDDGEPEVCDVCGEFGEVICCDSCPRVFHLECVNKTRVPRGTWYCHECTNPKNKKKSSPKAKKNMSSRKKSSRPVKRKLTYEESDESETEEEDVEEEESDQASDSDNVVKVKFGTTKKRSPEGQKSRRVISSDDEGDSDDGGRLRKRRSATEAAAKISFASKRLRRDYDESSESSSSNSRKRSRDDDQEELAGPKRTRLQRHNNNTVDDGELDNVLLDKLISDIMKQNDAWPFMKPVTRTEAPDYHDVVKYPMDLGTIKHKLNSMVYTCNEEFVSDLLLVFSNCFAYNDSSNHVHQVGLRLKEYCEKRCSKVGISFSDPVLPTISASPSPSSPSPPSPATPASTTSDSK